MLGGFVALAVIVAVAALLLKRGPFNHGRPTRTTSSTTAATPTTTPTTTAPNVAMQQAQSLNALLAQSSNDRSAIVAATNDIGNCGNLSQDQSTLVSAAQSRQGLLTQLSQLTLSQLPNSSVLLSSLTGAWQASMQADDDYAAWAGDRGGSGCGAPSSNDTNLRAAQVADVKATAAKTQFVNAWNPIAGAYGLPQYTQANV